MKHFLLFKVVFLLFKFILRRKAILEAWKLLRATQILGQGDAPPCHLMNCGNGGICVEHGSMV